MASRTEQRKQVAAGKVYLRFWIDEADIAWKLSALRYLNPNLADDREAISDAARRFLEDMTPATLRGDG